MRHLIIFSFLVLFLGCNSSEKNTKKSLKEVAKEIIVASKNCTLITVDSTGVANARAMDPFLPNEDFTIFMATNPKSAKVKEIQKNSKTTLYYFDAKTVGYVTLQGNSEIVNTKIEKEKYWKNEWKNFYKNRTTDYVLIKFTPNKGNIISEKYSILGDSITWKTPQLNF
jgi:general stress protein 26